MALKGASEDVRDKVLRNLSERAGEMLTEEIEDLGAVRMKDVEDSQQIIIKIIQDLEAKGEIVIGGRGGDEFIE
jgi:flagellar motor switch protein FliG